MFSLGRVKVKTTEQQKQNKLCSIEEALAYKNDIIVYKFMETSFFLSGITLLISLNYLIILLIHQLN